MKLRKAQELTAERLAERDDKTKQRHDAALTQAIADINSAHEKGKNRAHVFDVPESVDAVLKEHGYRVKMTQIDPQMAGPGTCRSIDIEWD